MTYKSKDVSKGQYESLRISTLYRPFNEVSATNCNSEDVSEYDFGPDQLNSEFALPPETFRFTFMESFSQ